MDSFFGGWCNPMKKNLNLILEESEIIELCQIIMDDDAEQALTFLKHHLKGKIRDLLEGG
jgi:hypothetical protein